MNVKTFPLGEIFKFLPKSKHKASDGLKIGKYPFFTSSQQQSKWFNEAGYKQEAIILGTGGMPSIHCAKDFSTSTDVFVMSPNNNEILAKYVYYFLLCRKDILEKGFKGAGLKHLSREYTKKIQIPFPVNENGIPDFSEQKRIVAILEEAEILKKKRVEATQKMDDFLLAFFVEIFGNPLLNQKKWITKPLSKVSRLERGRFSPRPRNDPTYFNGKYPFIQTGDISNSNYRIRKFTQTLNEKGIKVSKKFSKGNIVIAIVGATIGATAILEIDAYATDSVVCIMPDRAIVNNTFLEFSLRFWRKNLLKYAPEAARPNINLAILNNLKIILPPIALQDKFVAAVKEIELQKEKQNQSAKKIDEIFHSLLSNSYQAD